MRIFDEYKMKKYVLKNCPAYYKNFCDSEKEEYFCGEVTDCPLKRITEMCRKVACKSDSDIRAKMLASYILETLVIKEAE